MPEDQNTDADLPPYTASVPTAAEKKRSTKKYVIIAVSGILTAVIILTAILVGIYLFYNAQKDLFKFTLKANKNMKQDVISDPNNNVVQYHLRHSEYDLWVIDDFNRDIETVKVQNTTTSACYVYPLNRTMSLSPEEIINHQSKKDGKRSNPRVKINTVKYRPSDTTIPDISFLSDTAIGFCKGVSSYWMYPECHAGKDSKNQRIKRNHDGNSSCCCTCCCCCG